MTDLLIKLVNWSVTILGWVLNLILVPATLLYSALNSRVDLGVFSFTPATAVYYLWVSKGHIKCSNKAVSALYDGIAVCANHPLISAVAIVLLCVPALIVGVVKLLLKSIKTPEVSRDAVETPEILDEEDYYTGYGRKHGRRAKRRK